MVPFGAIHGVIHEHQRACFRMGGVLRQQRFDLQIARDRAPADVEHLLLGNGETDIDRLQLVDRDQRRAVGCDQVAGVRQPPARKAGDGRMDLTESELDAGAFDRCAIGSFGSLQGRQRGGSLVAVAFGNERLAEEIGEAPSITHRVLQLGLRAGMGGLGLSQRRLERTGIDAEQEVAGPDLGPFVEGDLRQGSGDLRAHGD